MQTLGFLGYLRWSEGSQANQFIMAVLVTFPTLTFGMIMGWVSPAIPQLQSSNGPLAHPMSDKQLSWLASVAFLVAIPSMLASGMIADAIGRKKCILIGTLSIIVCWLIQIIWLSGEIIIIARAISGIGNGLLYVTTPTYIKEISDESIRGALGSLFILAQNLGFLIMYIIADLLAFRTVLWVALVLPVVHFIIFLNAPETPSYLVKNKRNEEAGVVIAWLRSLKADDKKVSEEISDLDKHDVCEDSSEGIAAFKSLLTVPMHRKAFVICCVVLVCQECCGYLVLLTYASEVFEKAEVGSSVSPNQQTIILGCVQVAGSIVASCLVERIGRKPLLTIMSLITGLGMLVLGTCFYFSSRGSAPPGWLPVSAMCLSIFSTSAGFQPTAFIILPEMFSFKLRGIVSSIAISLTAISDFVQTVSFSPVTAIIGPQGTFWIFAAVCFMGTAFTVAFVPETKDKSLEEIYECLENRTFWKKKKSVEVSDL